MWDNKAILEKANAAITKGDYEGFLSMCTNDTEWSFMGDQTLRGKKAVREYMAAVYKEPPEFSVTNMVSEGDFVATLGTITLRNEQGIKEDYAYCDVWQFSEGKMAGLKAFVVKTKP